MRGAPPPPPLPIATTRTALGSKDNKEPEQNKASHQIDLRIPGAFPSESPPGRGKQGLGPGEGDAPAPVTPTPARPAFVKEATSMGNRLDFEKLRREALAIVSPSAQRNKAEASDKENQSEPKDIQAIGEDSRSTSTPKLPGTTAAAKADVVETEIAAEHPGPGMLKPELPPVQHVRSPKLNAAVPEFKPVKKPSLSQSQWAAKPAPPPAPAPERPASPTAAPKADSQVPNSPPLKIRWEGNREFRVPLHRQRQHNNTRPHLNNPWADQENLPPVLDTKLGEINVRPSHKPASTVSVSSADAAVAEVTDKTASLSLSKWAPLEVKPDNQQQRRLSEPPQPCNTLRWADTWHPTPEEQIRFVPSKAGIDTYRTVAITDLPPDITLRELTGVIRGGDLLSLDITRNLPLAGGKRTTMATAVFTLGKDARSYVSYARNQGVYLRRTYAGCISVRRLKVLLYQIPTMPPSEKLDEDVFENGCTRCLRVQGIPSRRARDAMVMMVKSNFPWFFEEKKN
ncbi:T-complex protein 1 subunit beta [Ascosphaera atra]|nr:T-complex protein 1 subunit beta [Ascosphaera atra]